MAIVHIQMTAQCAGGNHVRITSGVDSGPGKDYEWILEDFLAALDAVEQQSGTLTLIKLHGIGKTGAQLKADLLAGLHITV